MILEGVITVKLKIANKKTFYLPDNIEPSERLVEINKVLATEIEISNKKTTIEMYLSDTFNTAHTRTALDKIGTYLCKMPEQNGKHDREILSNNDVMEMEKGVRWTTKKGKKVLEKARYTNFSDLSLEDKAKLGLIDTDDFSNN